MLDKKSLTELSRNSSLTDSDEASSVDEAKWSLHVFYMKDCTDDTTNAIPKMVSNSTCNWCTESKT